MAWTRLINRFRSVAMHYKIIVHPPTCVLSIVPLILEKMEMVITPGMPDPSQNALIITILDPESGRFVEFRFDINRQLVDLNKPYIVNQSRVPLMGTSDKNHIEIPPEGKRRPIPPPVTISVPTPITDEEVAAFKLKANKAQTIDELLDE